MMDSALITRFDTERKTYDGFSINYLVLKLAIYIHFCIFFSHITRISSYFCTFFHILREYLGIFVFSFHILREYLRIFVLSFHILREYLGIFVFSFHILREYLGTVIYGYVLSSSFCVICSPTPLQDEMSITT